MSRHGSFGSFRFVHAGPGWKRGTDHSQAGRLTAADLLHVRQIVKRGFEMLREATRSARIE